MAITATVDYISRIGTSSNYGLVPVITDWFK